MKWAWVHFILLLLVKNALCYDFIEMAIVHCVQTLIHFYFQFNKQFAIVKPNHFDIENLTLVCGWDLDLQKFWLAVTWTTTANCCYDDFILDQVLRKLNLSGKIKGQDNYWKNIAFSYWYYFFLTKEQAKISIIGQF